MAHDRTKQLSERAVKFYEALDDLNCFQKQDVIFVNAGSYEPRRKFDIKAKGTARRAI